MIELLESLFDPWTFQWLIIFGGVILLGLAALVASYTYNRYTRDNFGDLVTLATDRIDNRLKLEQLLILYLAYERLGYRKTASLLSTLEV